MNRPVEAVTVLFLEKKTPTYFPDLDNIGNAIDAFELVFDGFVSDIESQRDPVAEAELARAQEASKAATAKLGWAKMERPGVTGE